MSKPHAVLVIGAGMLQVSLIHAAQDLGFQVIATDGNPDAPGMAVADYSYVMDTYDAMGTAAIIPAMQRQCLLRGVVTAGADVAPTVAACAERARLLGLPYATTCLTHDKGLVRERLSEADLDCYQPRWLFRAGDWAMSVRSRQIDAAMLGGWPIVVKPLEQRASRGVSIVHTAEALPAAVGKAMRYGEEYLLEECLVGTEHSAELILDNGQVRWWNVVDRYFDYSSGTGIELGHCNPSALPSSMLDVMRIMALTAADALGVHWGPFKIDVMQTPTGPKMLECTARLSGGWDAQWTSPATGRRPLRILVQLACGLPVEMPGVIIGAAACAAILPQKVGRVVTLPSTPPGMKVVWSIAPGNSIAPASHNGERGGYVLLHVAEGTVPWRGAQQEAWLCARDAARTLADLIDASLEDADDA